MTKDEALKVAHTTFMQLNERYPRLADGDGYFDKQIIACKEALERPKEWQGLSDDEVERLHKKYSLYIPTIKNIEAKLKEKNT